MFVANLVLEDTVERIYHGAEFAEQHVGLFIIRGENVVLLGEIVSLSTFLMLRSSSQHSMAAGFGRGRRRATTKGSL